MSHRLPLLSATAVLTLGLAGVVSASVGPLVPASGASPFGECTIGGPGTNYVNSEVEPWVAVNPADPDNLIGVYQQDRWDNGGAHGLVAAVSHDGGATWAVHTWAHFSRCSGGTPANGGDYDRASDPWVTFSPDGVAYQIALSFDQNDPVNGVLVSRSMDGGDTWSEPATLIRDTSWFNFNDKESITADPTNADYVYAVWDRSRQPGRPANLNAFHSYAFRGDPMFSRTTDGGQTWEPARNLFATNANLWTIGNQVAVLPNAGTLVDVFNLGRGSGVQPSPNQNAQAVMLSSDRGATWSKPLRIAQDLDVPVLDPDTGDYVRGNTFLPDIAVDPASDAIYVVWADGRFSGGTTPDVVLSKSTDGGVTWSEPVKVSATPAGVASFTPQVQVSADETVAVTYYDFRNNTSDPSTLPTDSWIRYSTDGGDSWGAEQRLTPESFDMRTAPDAGGFFVGDYEGLDSFGGNTFTPFLVQTTGDTANRTDAAFTTATPGP